MRGDGEGLGGNEAGGKEFNTAETLKKKKQISAFQSARCWTLAATESPSEDPGDFSTKTKRSWKGFGGGGRMGEGVRRGGG